MVWSERLKGVAWSYWCIFLWTIPKAIDDHDWAWVAIYFAFLNTALLAQYVIADRIRKNKNRKIKN